MEVALMIKTSSLTPEEKAVVLNYNRLEAGGLISRLEVGITLKRYWQYYWTDVRQNDY